MGKMFRTVEDYKEMFQDSINQTRDASPCSTNPTDNPVMYKLVRVAQDGTLVPATEEVILEVDELLENNESDMPIVPDPGQTDGYIPDEVSPSQFLQLESSNELSWNEEQVLSKVWLQEPIRFPSYGFSMDQYMDVSPYSNATGSPITPALSSAASKPEFSRLTGELCLDNHSIKALQETFRATFGRETTAKDKQWLKKRIAMVLSSGGQANDNDMTESFRKDTVDERRANNFEDTPSSPDCIKGHSDDFGHNPAENFVDHYSNGYLEGEYRSAKRVRKPTKRYIAEIDEKQQSSESLIPLKDHRSISGVSSGERVVVTRVESLAGSRIQVPYVSQARRSRPRENIMSLGEFHSCSWKVTDIPDESNLELSQSLLNNDMNRVSGVKSVSGPAPKKLPINHRDSSEVDQDIMETEHIDSSGISSDDNLPIMQRGIRRKHHRAWTPSEVIKLLEGVSKYGVGKWSDIKRLSFSSNPYRTSVDLKDKWRNLLKASSAQMLGSLKKHGSMAIPSHVLVQVRELAEKQSMVSRASKARMLKGSRNGFL